MNMKQFIATMMDTLTYVGAILLDHYNTKEKLEKLLELGDLSLLDIKTEPDPNLPHSFDGVRQDDVCVAYGRDRGEQGTEAKIRTLNQLLNADWIEYFYIFGEDDKWHYYSCEDEITEEHDLEEDLNNEYKKYGIKRPENFYCSLCDDLVEEIKRNQQDSNQDTEM